MLRLDSYFRGLVGPLRPPGSEPQCLTLLFVLGILVYPEYTNFAVQVK